MQSWFTVSSSDTTDSSDALLISDTRGWCFQLTQGSEMHLLLQKCFYVAFIVKCSKNYESQLPKSNIANGGFHRWAG